MNVTLVYNPKSGSALEPRELKRRFRVAGIMITRLVPIKDGFERRLKAPIAGGERIAVIGGDGTINSVAALVMGTDATLIPLPGGTFNNFTKDLGIPQDLDEALAHLKSAKLRRVDVGKVNDVVFVNNSSIGLYPQTLRLRESHEESIGKWPAALFATVKTALKLRLLNVTIDGKKCRTPFVFVGNNRYVLDGVGLTDRNQLDEGVLTVFVARTSSRLGLLKIGVYTLFGQAEQLEIFDIYHPESLVINTRRPSLSVSHDGEVSKMATPLEFSICKKALKVL